MRPIWTGSISFGLVNIPVKLFSAVLDSSLDLDMLDTRDHSNIKFKRINENTGEEVVNEDIVKGYKLNDAYVVLEDSDFESADAEKTKTIKILNFADLKEIDSIYYEQPYYLEPEKSAINAYALLRDALKSSGKVGVSTFVLRNREGLAILKPSEKVIVLNRIRFKQEIRDPSELKLPEVSKSKTQEMEIANMLIKQLTQEFNIDKYKDTYTEKLLKIIEAKSKGKKSVPSKLKVVQKQNDLMSMLKASLEDSNKKAS